MRKVFLLSILMSTFLWGEEARLKASIDASEAMLRSSSGNLAVCLRNTISTAKAIADGHKSMPVIASAMLIKSKYFDWVMAVCWFENSPTVTGISLQMDGVCIYQAATASDYAGNLEDAKKAAHYGIHFVIQDASVKKALDAGLKGFKITLLKGSVAVCEGYAAVYSSQEGVDTKEGGDLKGPGERRDKPDQRSR